MHELNGLPTPSTPYPSSAHIYNRYENERTNERTNKLPTDQKIHSQFLSTNSFSCSSNFTIEWHIFESRLSVPFWKAHFMMPHTFISYLHRVDLFFFSLYKIPNVTQVVIDFMCEQHDEFKIHFHFPFFPFSSVPFSTQFAKWNKNNKHKYYQIPRLKGSVIFIFYRKIFVFTLVYCELMAVVVVEQSIVSVFCVTQ